MRAQHQKSMEGFRFFLLTGIADELRHAEVWVEQYRRRIDELDRSLGLRGAERIWIIMEMDGPLSLSFIDFVPAPPVP